VAVTFQSPPIPFFILGISQLGQKQGLGIVTCNTDDSVVIGLLCVFLEAFLTEFYFRVPYCPHLQSCTPFPQVPYVP